MAREREDTRRPSEQEGVIIYAQRGSGIADSLKEALLDVVPPDHMEVLGELKALESRLRALPAKHGREILVMAPSDQGDLEGIIAMRDFLLDVPLILILPDQMEATVSKAHSLYPRFLSYADVGPGEARAVLKKMLRQVNNIHQRTRNGRA